ncbi:MAG: thioredoxin family protein, partial [Flavisolibacter sp.]|nr:thioredoxin family protein [Flavisolibacter sp.]
MKTIFCSIFYALPFLLQAQNGVKWMTNLSWEEIKRKAQTENKYIFVDCYATWCAPCKLMDSVVYSSEKIAEHLGKKFIAFKIQLDSSSADTEEIRKRYADAVVIKTSF